jgi:hypothetical protein
VSPTMAAGLRHGQALAAGAAAPGGLRPPAAAGTIPAPAAGAAGAGAAAGALTSKAAGEDGVESMCLVRQAVMRPACTCLLGFFPTVISQLTGFCEGAAV